MTQGTRRTRVVTLVDLPARGGGAERVASDIATGLDRERFESTLCISRWKSSYRDSPEVAEELARLGDAGVRFVGLERRGRRPWAWGKLLKLLRREKVDVLHAHKFGSNVWGTVIGRAAGVPAIVAHEHTWSFEGEPLRRFLDRELIGRGADAFLAVSRADRQRMIELEGIPADKVLFVPNGIRATATPTGRDFRGELGIEPGTPVVGTVCVLRPQKALEVLVEAAATLAERFPALRVLVAGEGDERERLEGMISSRGLGSTVTLLGHVADVPDLLAALDVAVCCSDFEGSPLSVMEYMEAGRPVVATRVGGLPDLIEDGVHGLLVPRRDPAALATAIGRLVERPELAAEMGRRGQERRRHELDVATTVRRIEALYEELLARKRPRPGAGRHVR